MRCVLHFLLVTLLSYSGRCEELLGITAPGKQVAIAAGKDGLVEDVLIAPGGVVMAGQTLVTTSAETISAPVSGTVSKILKAPGNAARAQEKIVELVDLDTLIVRVYASPSLRRSLQMNRQIGVQCGGVFKTGKITFADASNDPATGLFVAWIRIENADRKLIPGQNASVTIQ